MDKNLENQLNELMMKNQKKFADLIEKVTGNFKDKYNKEIYIKNKEKLRIMDGSSPSDYFTSLEILEDWIDKCIDDIRNYVKSISYPMFVYLYLDLILKDFWEEARLFFEKFSSKYISFKEELEQLANLKEPLNTNNPILTNYLKNKIHIYIPRTVFDFFIHFLNTNNLILILDILNKFFERSNLLSKVLTVKAAEGADNFVLLNLTGEELEKINGRTSIYYNRIKKDQDFQFKTKGKGRGEKSSLAKVIIPIPDSYLECLPLETPNLKIDKNNLPNIGCFTMLNSHNKLNCADLTTDGSIVACGYKDGTIEVWIVDKDMNIDINENVIKSLEEYRDVNIPKITGKKTEDQMIKIKIDNNLKQGEQNEDDLSEGVAYEEIIKKQRKFRLLGHSDSVFSLNISQNKKFIVSGSYDETIRLWSVFTKSTLVVYKGHYSPVLSVKFSPFCHYFASGGCDRTARLWGMNSPGPLRMFVGHLSDVELVDFHPNSFYLVTSANDKTIRLWSLESGECVRIFFNYSQKSNIDCISFSNSGKIMAVACDKSLILYDLVKMGDPIRIVDNMTQKSILSILFDNEDNTIVVSTEEYKILFYDLHSILNDNLSLKINNSLNNNLELLCQYATKKASIIVMKYTLTNVLLTLGRFDDNDPKIFM